MASVKSAKHITLVVVCIAAVVCGNASRCRAQQGPAVSQRKINEMAASLDRCRRTLIETPAIRQQGETLPAYIQRISAPLVGESKTGYLKRVSSYVRALARTANETASFRVPPTLKHADAANQSLWQRATRDISYLPKRMDHVAAAWSHAEQHTEPEQTKALATEILETVQLMIDAYTNLRDAAP